MIKIFYKEEWWYLFGCKYKFDGKEYSIDFYARNNDEAHLRIAAMKERLEYDGQTISSKEIPDLNMN